MTKAHTRRFFVWGSIVFSAIFIALTVHTHTTLAERTNSAGLTPEVVHGLHVWGANNCEGCHTLMGEGAYYAPDLTKIVEQRGATYLGAFLAKPSDFYSEERDGRLMPDLGLAPDEIHDVIAFLEWVGKVDMNGWPPRPILVSGVSARGVITPGSGDEPAGSDAVSTGQTIFNGKGGCAACHSVSPGTILVGPSLAGVGDTARTRIHEPSYAGSADSAAAYLRESITTPSAYLVPGDRFAANGVSLMPGMYPGLLTTEDVDALVAYLDSLADPARR